MHELSLCEALLRQLHDLARRNDAVAVSRVELRVGALSGVEPALLAHAFAVARAGSVAEEAELTLTPSPPRVRCPRCAALEEVPPNRLRCPRCGSTETELVGGDELLLARVELLRRDGSAAGSADRV